RQDPRRRDEGDRRGGDADPPVARPHQDAALHPRGDRERARGRRQRPHRPARSACRRRDVRTRQDRAGIPTRTRPSGCARAPPPAPRPRPPPPAPPPPPPPARAPAPPPPRVGRQDPAPAREPPAPATAEAHADAAPTAESRESAVAAQSIRVNVDLLENL